MACFVGTCKPLCCRRRTQRPLFEYGIPIPLSNSCCCRPSDHGEGDCSVLRRRRCCRMARMRQRRSQRTALNHGVPTEAAGEAAALSSPEPDHLHLGCGPAYRRVAITGGGRHSLPQGLRNDGHPVAPRLTAGEPEEDLAYGARHASLGDVSGAPTVASRVRITVKSPQQTSVPLRLLLRQDHLLSLDKRART